MIYRINPNRDRFSNLIAGHIFGKKIKNKINPLKK